MVGAALVGCSGGQRSPGPDGGAGCRSDGACPIFAAPAGQSAQNPCYSPDGARLLFTLFRGGYNVGPSALLTVAVSGGAAALVIDDGSTNVDLPGTSWNAATNRISFTSDKFGADCDRVPPPPGNRHKAGIPWYLMLVEGRFKYIRTLEANEPEELYDLQADPEELHNLASDPAQAARLKKLGAAAIAELERTGAKMVHSLPPVKPVR